MNDGITCCRDCRAACKYESIVIVWRMGLAHYATLSASFLRCRACTCLLKQLKALNRCSLAFHKIWDKTNNRWPCLLSQIWKKKNKKWMNEPGVWMAAGEREVLFIEDCSHPTPGYLWIRTVRDKRLRCKSLERPQTHAPARTLLQLTHTVTLILWPWRHQSDCVTQVDEDVGCWGLSFHLVINE